MIPTGKYVSPDLPQSLLVCLKTAWKVGAKGGEHDFIVFIKKSIYIKTFQVQLQEVLHDKCLKIFLRGECQYKIHVLLSQWTLK